MSVRVDTTSIIPGSVVCGNRGLGVTGAYVIANTATGANGPGVLYNCFDAGDEAKEFRAMVSAPPASGTFFMYEDGSFTLTAPADGAFSLVFSLYVDGVLIGSVTNPITVGSGAATVSGSIAGISLSAVNGAATATGTTRRISLTLYTAGTAAASVSNISAAMWISGKPGSFSSAPNFQASGLATAFDGSISLDVTSSGAVLGQTVWLDLTNSDGTISQSPVALSFSGPVTVS